ncbi:MAG: HPr family phosphocarrier protein [Nitrincola lacisaponensis]|uniref:Phosphocarrier protein, nitrogen regulation associated n=1 Tax=Nitrincola lacisaponensis TaxID=267850 RepID=A0A063Y6J5_9GAMM|nr:HPr family phosphocarrier protein [Nitrincola lacisaponensis]KDE40770.1 Phosphocarrier protein, nitrogen regulation associated [Nitrincola lacisaponensis]
MIKAPITIINKLGLHARAAAKLSTLAGNYASQIQVEKNGRCVDCKSIMAVMMLAASKGTELILHIEGDDETEAHSALTTLINNRFDEPE